MPLDGTGLNCDPELLGKIDKVIDLLSREEFWCKQQLRSYDGRRCMLGAMMAADAALVLKRPVLHAVKQLTGRDYLRIESFNDHPSTTHATILAVLNQARDNIRMGALLPMRTASRGATVSALWSKLVSRFAWS